MTEMSLELVRNKQMLLFIEDHNKPLHDVDDIYQGSLKIGLVIPLHKKGDKNNPNNFHWGVLLAMESRILARILASRVD